MIGRTASGSHLKQNGGIHRAGINDESRDGHAIHVGHGDDRQSRHGPEGRHTQSQKNRIGIVDRQRAVKRVSAGSEQDILARASAALRLAAVSVAGCAM